jgi:hypothetical protein
MVQQPIFSMPGDPLITDTQNTGREGLAGPFWSKPYRIVFGYCPTRRYYLVPTFLIKVKILAAIFLIKDKEFICNK